MDISKILLNVVFICSCQHLCEKLGAIIINKINNKDFKTINVNKDYVRVLITYDTDNYIRGEIKTVDEVSNEQNIRTIYVYYRFISLKQAVENFENQLMRECKNELSKYFIIIYTKSIYEKCPIYRSIVQRFEKINKERNKKRFNCDIYYEYILDDHNMWSNYYIKIIDATNRNYECDEINTYSPIINLRKHLHSVIRFNIYFDDIYYLFDVDPIDLYCDDLIKLVRIITFYDNLSDTNISKYVFDLYKFVRIPIINTSFTDFSIYCSLNMIECANEKFKIEISNGQVLFSQKEGYYYYFLEKGWSIFYSYHIINKQCFADFQECFIKVSRLIGEDDFSKEVEWFFRLIACSHNLEFLMNIIITKRHSSIKIIFAHILLDQQLITKNDLDDAVSDDKLNDKRRKKFINALLAFILNHENASTSFMMKLFLFIECETYMNENDVSEDATFDTLKKIGHNIIDREYFQGKMTLSYYLKSKNLEIDLLKTYREILKVHLMEIRTFQIDMDDYIIKLISLFTGSEKNICTNSVNMTEITKREIITRLIINENELESKNEIIRTKLEKYTNENQKKEEKKCIKEIKKINKEMQLFPKNLKYLANKLETIFKKITIPKIIKALNKIKSRAYNVRFNNIFELSEILSFENEMKQQGIKEIEYVLKNDNLIKAISALTKGSEAVQINEFKINVKERFFKDLKHKIFLNIKNKRLKYFNLYLMEYLDSIMKNDTIKKTECENKILNIKKLFSEDAICIIFEGKFGIKLVKDLIKVFAV
ncbi:uncharacterized protein VNE69_04083 [Vairimorpha necatrix]|uniref:Uncharacterized protein n=1 Tax=Vairimorpha necatrix TaxID=6039 RepID=A0AAX4JB98_9MICR